MRTWMVLFSATILVVACDQGSETEPSAAKSTIDAAREAVASLPVARTVEGTLGCGHCTFETSEECTAALRTAEGEVILFDGVSEDSPLFRKRLDGGEVKVTGNSTTRDGVTHMTVVSYTN